LIEIIAVARRSGNALAMTKAKEPKIASTAMVD
jgi:hypothetical protein